MLNTSSENINNFIETINEYEIAEEADGKSVLVKGGILASILAVAFGIQKLKDMRFKKIQSQTEQERLNNAIPYDEIVANKETYKKEIAKLRKIINSEYSKLPARFKKFTNVARDVTDKFISGTISFIPVLYFDADKYITENYHKAKQNSGYDKIEQVYADIQTSFDTFIDELKNSIPNDTSFNVKSISDRNGVMVAIQFKKWIKKDNKLVPSFDLLTFFKHFGNEDKIDKAAESLNNFNALLGNVVLLKSCDN